MCWNMKLNRITWSQVTFEWAANQSCSHADVSMPADRMKSYVSSYEWRIQRMEPLLVFVRISTEFLQKIHS